MAPLPPARVRSLPARIWSLISNRIAFKLAAIFFSLVLWLVVSAEEPSEELVPVRLELITDPHVSLRGEPEQVRALVVGRGRELIKLFASPPVVRRVISADVPQRYTLELRPTDVDLPSGVEARVREVLPRSIVLVFDITAERNVPVRSELRVRAIDGWRVVGQPRFDPESVRVAGPRAAVDSVTAVSTEAIELLVDETSRPMVALDTSRGAVRVTPERVRVRVPVARVEEPPDTVRSEGSLAPDTTAQDSLPPTPTDSAARGDTGRGRRRPAPNEPPRAP
jgi:YbbR domain-containing protein